MRSWCSAVKPNPIVFVDDYSTEKSKSAEPEAEAWRCADVTGFQQVVIINNHFVGGDAIRKHIFLA